MEQELGSVFDQLATQSNASIDEIQARSWGTFKTIRIVKENDAIVYKEKILTIKAGSDIQLHAHNNYSELWLSKDAFKYSLENENLELVEYLAKPYERVFIPKNRKHKIVASQKPLQILEIQIGIIKDDDNLKFD